MAKLHERQLKLDAAKAKAAQEVVEEDRIEAIESGRSEFIRAVEELDFSAREVVVSTVLQSFKNDARCARIQAWIATILEREPRVDPTPQTDQVEAAPSANPPPAPNQSESTSASPQSEVDDSKPKE